MESYDLAIVGGGMVGASLARALANSNLKIAVLDKLAEDCLYASATDNRGLALSTCSIKILEELNIWELLKKEAYPIKTVHVSEKGCFGFAKIDAEKLNYVALGYVLNASHIGKALITNLDNFNNVTCYRPILIKAICFDNIQKNWQIICENKKISAKVVVAADGTNSYLRKCLSISSYTNNYQQTALVANLRCQQEKNTIAYQRLTPHGPIALLPFGNNRVKCVWSVDNMFADNLLKEGIAGFVSKIQQNFGNRLGRLSAIDSGFKDFPIMQVIAKQLVGQSMVLIGNAANTLHPVTAQGLNLGLRDSAILAKLFLHAVKDSSLQCASIPEILQSYVKLRKDDHAKIIQLTNYIHMMYANHAVWARSLRRCGILAVQLVPKLTRYIADLGLGSHGVLHAI